MRVALQDMDLPLGDAELELLLVSLDVDGDGGAPRGQPFAAVGGAQCSTVLL
jgi:hypothetical protein